MPEDLLESFAASTLRLDDSAHALLDRLLAHRDFVAARLSLDDPALGRPMHFEARLPMADRDRMLTVRQSLIYGAEVIGTLEVGTLCDTAGIVDIQAGLARLSRPLARYCRRYAVEKWCSAEFGQTMSLVGVSAAILSFEALLERASLSDLPVLIAGEFGTEKLLCALSIHCLGTRRNGPFIEVNCSEPHGDPSAWFAAAESGTLFLNGIEKLSNLHQERVPLYMRSHLGQWLKGPGAGDVRVIASAADDLAQRSAQGRFSRALLAEVDILGLVLPPLRQRRADIETLVDWALRRRGFDPERKKTAAMIAVFRDYDWPENLVELERVATRLAVMTEDNPIGRAEIDLYTPWIANPISLPLNTPAPPPESAATADRPAAPDWAEILSSQDEASLETLHPGLRRALKHLATHYTRPLTLDELADLSHVSASHLGYLFRVELGSSFKQLQQRLRILHSRRLLVARGRLPVTEIALTVGFSDLSHFEKAFRKQIGESPRAYRQSWLDA